MQVLKHFGDFLAKLFALPPRAFTCGDCERNAQCGLPPHEDCLHRIEQISRGETYPRRPTSGAIAGWPR